MEHRSRAVASGPALSISPSVPRRLADALEARVAECPDGTVRTYGLDGEARSATYRELWQRSGLIAAGLRKFGARSGDTILLLIDDVVDFVPAFWACIRGGFIAAPLMALAREARHRGRGGALREALSRLTCVTILADDKFAEIANVLNHERGLPLLSLAAAEVALEHGAVPVPAAEPICVLPTAGSTGGPKLVALPESAIIARAFANDCKRDGHWLGTFALDSISAHSGSFLAFGSWTQLPAETFTSAPTCVLDAIERHQITSVGLTNSAAKQIVAAAGRSGRRWNLQSLRQVGLGAETVVRKTAQMLAELIESHGASKDIIRAGYGTTETGLLVTGANPLNPPIRDGSPVALGSCAPGVALRVVSPDNEVLSEAEVGDIQVRCPSKMFSGYWGDPETTRQGFTRDGWWRTGDLGSLVDGTLSIHGRAKELIVLHGKKFSLAEIDAECERVLPVDVRAFCCAIHWPDEQSERLAVAVTARDFPDRRRTEITEAVSRAVVRRYGFRPSPIILAPPEQIPFAGNGKLCRPELAMRIRAGTIGVVEDSSRHLAATPNIQALPPCAGETALAEIWRDVLDIKGDIDRHASFFDLGGDSLRAVMLDSAIEERFGKRIAAETFFKTPTFENLLALIEHGGAELPATNGAASDGALLWPLPPALRNKLLLHFETWEGHRPTRDRLMIGVNTAGSKTPLFWVFQNAVQFRQLAKNLDADQPFYALRSGVKIIDYTEDEIQTLALRYVTEITEVCPEGSLFVGGACQGGIIALAVAQHLLRRKRHVPLLILEEWEYPLQPYAGPVLLIHGKDSRTGNPYRRFQDPHFAFRRMFAKYDVVETPGDHSNRFDDGYVETWTAVMLRHMREAELSAPLLIPRAAYRMELIAHDIPDSMPAGARVNVIIRVLNTSSIKWPAWDQSGLALGNRWLDETGKIIEWIDGRVPLPELQPDQEISVDLPITAPRSAGLMQLAVDVVEEGSTWFHGPHDAPLRASIRILGDGVTAG